MIGYFATDHCKGAKGWTWECSTHRGTSAKMGNASAVVTHLLPRPGLAVITAVALGGLSYDVDMTRQFDAFWRPLVGIKWCIVGERDHECNVVGHRWAVR